VLCVTALPFKRMQSGTSPHIIFNFLCMPYWTRHAGKKSARNCHMFVKGLSGAHDKRWAGERYNAIRREFTVLALQPAAREPTGRFHVQSTTCLIPTG
jgi:hypothetical protein